MQETGERCTQNLNPWGLSWKDAVAGMLLQGVLSPELDAWVSEGCQITPIWKQRLDKLAQGNTVGYAPSSVPGYPPFRIPIYPEGGCPRAACYMRPNDMVPSYYGRPGFFGSTVPAPPLGGRYGRVAGWSGMFPGDGLHLGRAWRILVPRGAVVSPLRRGSLQSELAGVLRLLREHFPAWARFEPVLDDREIRVYLLGEVAFDRARPCPKPHRIGSWSIVYFAPADLE